MNFNFITLTPRMYGWEHLTYLGITFPLCILAIILIKLFIKKEESLRLTFRIIGVILFGLIIWNRICISIRDNNWWLLIPDSYCGLCSFALSLIVMFGKKDNILFHFICYIGIVGGLSAVLYPNFLSQDESFLYHATISGLLHHTVMFFTIILIYLTKWFTPTLKKWYVLPLGICICTTIGTVELQFFNIDDAFNILTPIIGNKDIYTWVIAIAIFIASLITEYIYDKYRYKKHKEVLENK